MKNKAIFTVGLFVLLVGCNNEKSSKPEVVEKEKEGFKISLNLVIPKDDSLQVFYTEDQEGIYEEQNSVWAVVEGSEQEQVASFNLPSEVLPTHLRIDLGQNKEQKEVAIKNFKMEYLGQKFEVKDTMFYQFFQPVNQIEWDRKKAVAKIVTPSGEKHDPNFNPRETLKQEINKLVMGPGKNTESQVK